MRKDMYLSTPILLVIYKRKHTALKVIESIANIKSQKIYIAQDGPRNKKEEKIILETRKTVLSQINWSCKVETDFINVNLGLRRRMESAITWLFKKEERGIILEDDCVADQSFFQFCRELLEKYKSTSKVMAITGDNFLQGNKEIKDSYYFSKYPHCWGWATWRRAWRLYDDKMKDWPKLREGDWLRSILKNKLAEIYWKNIFDLVYEEKINSWAYRWQYSCWLNSGLTIIPNVNLVKNIGQGLDASNTKMDLETSKMEVGKIIFPIKHPNRVELDEKADLISERNKILNVRNFAGLYYKKYLQHEKR